MRSRLPLLFSILLISAFAPLASAATAEFRIPVNVDRESTGCTITVGGAVFSGADRVVTVRFELGTPAPVASVAVQTCTDGAWSAEQPLAPNSAAAAWVAASGQTDVELQVPLSMLGISGGTSQVALGLAGQVGIATDTLFGPPPVLHPEERGRRRSAGIQRESTIIIDGNFTDWSGFDAIAARADGGTAAMRIRKFYALRSPEFFWFRIEASLSPSAPTAVDDAYSTRQGYPVSVPPPGVLQNDINPLDGPLTAAVDTPPANGLLMLEPDGSFMYVHDGSSTQPDSFKYRASNGTADSNAATVTISISPNGIPNAGNDNYSVAHRGTLTIPPPGVLGNDSDPDGDPIGSSIASGPAHGSVSLNGDGSFTYTHNGSNTLSDSFTYRVSDGGASSLGQVNITIGPDQAPVAVADAYTLAEGGTLNVPAPGVLANDSDPDTPASFWSAQVVAATTNGTLTLNPNGSFSYVHNGSETLSDSFTYRVFDGIVYSGPVTVTFTITAVDDAPVAVGDASTVAEDSAATAIDVLLNDTDVDAGPKAVAAVTQPANGTVVITGGGTGLTYQPAANYCNTPPGTALDTFTYTLNGGSTATVTVTVTCVDDAPVAVNDTATVAEDSGASAVDVLANDTDVDAGPISIASVTQPANGTVVITGGGTGLTYSPAANYCGSDSFTYTLAPGASVGTVSVSVTCTDDAPVAVNDAATVAEDSGANAIAVLANDTDIDAGPIAISAVTQPANGTVVVTGGGTGLTYAPAANYCGSDSFTYTLAPGSSTATVTVTVSCINDAPVVDLDASAAGIDYAVTFTEGEAAKLIIDATDATILDVDSANLASMTVTISNLLDPTFETLAANVAGTSIVANYNGGTGVLTLTGPDTVANFITVLRTVTYLNTDVTPDETVRVINFVANDGGASSATAVSSVTVVASDTAPTAVNDSATVTEDSGANTINVIANDTDPDAGPVSVASVTQPANGTVVITNGGADLTYTPNANYCNNPPGTTLDTFTYTLAPGGSTATVTVTVTCVDDSPVAVADAATVNEDSGASAINVLANDTDTDGGAISIASSTQPANGTVVITGGGTGLTYQPNLNYCNTPPGTTLDTFTYTLTPGGSSTTVTVTVTCVDDNPTAVADAATVNEDSGANAIDVLANDADVDSGAISVTSVTQPANGTVAITGGGTGLTYTPNANYCNTPPGTTLDTFTYTLTPGGSTTTVTVTVNCVDDAPVAVNDAATVNEDSGANTINVLANDTDLDGGAISITSVTQGTNGSVVITNGGADLTYAPNANYCGADTFTYSLTPGGSTATVTVTVTCLNDAPAVDLDANDDKGTPGANFAVTFTEGDPATVIADAADASIIDIDSATLVGVTVTITNILDPGSETLAADVSGTSIVANYVAATGVLTLTGPDTVANFQTVLRKVTYLNIDIAPDTTPRVINVVATDSVGANSNTAISTITIVGVDTNPTAVNDAPTVNEDSGANAIDVLANDTDPDGGAISITSVTQPANGTVVITGGGTGVTYAPNANYCGADTFTYTLTPGGSTATVNVTVTCVDDNPVAVADAATVGEDSGANAIPVLANDTDADGGPISITSVTQGTNGAVVITGGGTGLTYQPNANYCGSDSFTYTLTPGGSSTTVTITVTCVDDNPVAVADSATVVEDSSSNAINVLANDTDVDGGSISISSASDPANGSATVTGGGTGVSYTPDPNYCGADSFTYTLTPGGSSTTVTMTVTCVDDPPVAVADAATVVEDSAVNAVPVLANDTDVDAGPISITSVTQPSNGTVVITGGGTGLTYAPNPNYCNNPPGTTLDTFTYTLTPGGSSTTVTVTVTCVNDAPVADNDTFDFVGNTDLVVDLAALSTPHALESTPSTFGVIDGDSDPVEGDAISVTAITVGACVDASAPLDCSDPAVGRVQMQSNGRFIFTPAPGDSGATETFQYTLTDNGLPAPASTTATVTLTRFERVWYVKNDAPAGGNGTSSSPFNSITAANLSDNDSDGDLTDDLDSAGDYIFVYFGNGTASGMSGGLVLEGNQHLIGQHTGLSLNVNLNANGAPTNLVAAAPGSRPLLDDTVVDAFEGVSARNVIPAEIVGMNLAGNVNAIDWTTTAAFAGTGEFSIRDNVIRSATNEGVDINLAGTAATRLAFHDNNLTAAGNALDIQETGTGALTITRFDDNIVSGNTVGVGIVINTAVFDSVPGGSFDSVNGGSTTIGASGNPVGGAGMTLTSVVGALDLTDLDIFAAGAGLTLSGTGAFTGASGTRLTVPNGVSVIETSNGPAVDISGATIDLRLASLAVAASPTTGVSLVGVSDATVAPTAAQFSAGSGSTISNVTGTDFNVDGGNGTVSYAGSITNSAGRSVAIQNRTGDSVTFASGSTITDTGTGILVNASCAGCVTDFLGTMTLNTGANAAFAATSGGTLRVLGAANTITTTTGVALNVTSTTIGTGSGAPETGLRFRSISAGTGASGPANGIVLNATGSSGSLTVTGTGGAGTGGTIQRTTGHGISLTNTLSPSFTNMTILNPGGSGVKGTTVTNFTYQNGQIDGAGTALGAETSAIAFNDQSLGTENNLSGVVMITGNTFNNPYYHGVDIYNHAGTISSLTVSNNSITSTTSTATSKGSGIRVVAFGGASAAASVNAATVTSNTISNFPSGAGITMQGGNANGAGAPMGTLGIPGSGSNLIDIQSNQIIGQSAAVKMGTNAIQASVNGVGRLNVNIANNGTAGSKIRNIAGNVISVSVLGNSTGTVTIANNFIDANHTANFGGPLGISVGAGRTFATTDTSNLTVSITGNNVTNTDGNGILARAVEGQSTMLIAVKNNTVSAPLGGTRPGIRVDSGDSVSNSTVCLDMSNNVTAGSGGNPGIGVRRQGTGPGNVFGIEGLPGGASNNAVEDFLGAQNPSSAFGSPGFSNDGTRTVRAIVLSGSNFSNCNTAP